MFKVTFVLGDVLLDTSGIRIFKTALLVKTLLVPVLPSTYQNARVFMYLAIGADFIDRAILMSLSVGLFLMRRTVCGSHVR